jgi:hypothetical protein
LLESLKKLLITKHQAWAIIIVIGGIDPPWLHVSREMVLIGDGIIKPERLKILHFFQYSDNQRNVTRVPRFAIFSKCVPLATRIVQQNLEFLGIMEFGRQRFSTPLRGGNSGQLEGEFAM